MKKIILLIVFPLIVSCLPAQGLTGVWQGILSVDNYNGNVKLYNNIAKLDPVTGHPIRNVADAFPPYQVLVRTEMSNSRRAPVNNPSDPRQPVTIEKIPWSAWMDSNKLNTRARLEILELDGKIMAQLTSYGDDNQQITVYEFKGTKKGEDKYLFRGSHAFINETEGEAPAFDLEASGKDSSGISILKGKWRGQMSRNILGDFHFVRVAESFTMNPEWVHLFINPKNDAKLTALSNNWLPPATALHDTLETTSFFIDGSVLDNGIPDHDTLSIWFNERLLEEDVVLSKKRFLFHASLTSQEWNHLSIRCKSDGTIKGTGFLLNMRTDERILKYQVVMYPNNQVDWLIRHTDRKKNLRPDQ